MAKSSIRSLPSKEACIDNQEIATMNGKTRKRARRATEGFEETRDSGAVVFPESILLGWTLHGSVVPGPNGTGAFVTEWWKNLERQHG